VPLAGSGWPPSCGGAMLASGSAGCAGTGRGSRQKATAAAAARRRRAWAAGVGGRSRTVGAAQGVCVPVRTSSAVPCRSPPVTLPSRVTRRAVTQWRSRACRGGSAARVPDPHAFQESSDQSQTQPSQTITSFGLPFSITKVVACNHTQSSDGSFSGHSSFPPSPWSPLVDQELVGFVALPIHGRIMAGRAPEARYTRGGPRRPRKRCGRSS